ncbi:MAG: NMD3-related protein [Infirmifilum sp.]
MRESPRCPVCGRTVERLVNGLCEECYRREHPLLELKTDHVELEVCRICGSLRFKKGKWVSSRDEAAEELRRMFPRLARSQGQIRYVKVELPSSLSLVVFKVTGRASPELQQDYTEEYTLKVSVKKTICNVCLGHVSKKKNAIIQIRAQGRKLEQTELNNVVKLVEDSVSEVSMKDPLAVPVEVEEKPEGLDLYFSEYTAARKIAEALQRRVYMEVLETSKHIGVDESGHGKFKRTIRLLLPGFVQGDVVTLGGSFYYVARLTRRYVELLDLERYTTTRLPLNHETTSKISVVAHEKDLPEGLVVSKSGSFIQVLELGSYRTIEAYFSLESAVDRLLGSERVKLFFHGEKTYLIPLPGNTPQLATQ